MTAEPTGYVAWSPDPIKQRNAGYTLEDVFNLPDDAPRVELWDGVLTVTPSPAGGHQKINWRLASWLEHNLPVGYEPQMAVGVVMGFRRKLEPDAVIMHSPVDEDHHYYEAEQVVVAIEIVSPGTRKTDRFTKPARYAEAGIPHYWRIEQHPIHIFAYDLRKGRYEPAADSADELVLSAPFDIRLPIRDLAK
ncbi:Uma2 family endonuclease [Actinoplanes sp. CA-054009]